MIIDAHAHIGEDLGRKGFGLSYNCDAYTLAKLIKENDIYATIVAPSPGQIVCRYLGSENRLHYYNKDLPTLVESGEKMRFRCQCGEEWAVVDPFKEANEYIFRVVENLNKKQETNFYPIPIIHPLKQKVCKDVLNFYERFGIKGIKIHPFVDGVDPRRYIDSELVDIIKKYELKILFHTDVSGPAHPENILDFAENTGIKCQLSHSCWGDKNSLIRIRERPNVITDIQSLETLLSNRDRLLTEREFHTSEKFIKHVIQLVGKSKCVVGSDYYWCGWTEDSYKKHWEQFKAYDSKSLYENAAKFWNIELL